MTRELAPYKFDIATLSDTRLPDKGQLSLNTFLRRVDERREVSIGSAIKSFHVKKLASIPEDRNDSLMKMQLLLVNGKTATLISAYNPTMTNPEKTKGKFYEELEVEILAVPQPEKLFCLAFSTHATAKTTKPEKGSS